jgi:hypothetical protein
MTTGRLRLDSAPNGVRTSCGRCFFARGMDGQQIEVQTKQLLKDLENIIHKTLETHLTHFLQEKFASAVNPHFDRL